MLDLLERKTDPETLRYAIIHLVGEDIEVVMTHGQQYGEEYYSFVNGQNTTAGGTHLQALPGGDRKTLRDFYNKNFDTRDVQASIIGAISLKVEEPVLNPRPRPNSVPKIWP